MKNRSLSAQTATPTPAWTTWAYRSLFPVLCVGLFAVLGSSDAFALNDTVYVQAKPLYNDGWIGSGTPMRTDLGTAFSDVEAISDQCTYGYGGASQCNTISNLRGDPSPTAIIVNDSPSLYVWDALGCSTPAGGSTTCD